MWQSIYSVSLSALLSEPTKSADGIYQKKKKSEWDSNQQGNENKWGLGSGWVNNKHVSG